MSRRGPDFQKQEAKRSLWDHDGEHVPHKYRKKGRGRRKDKSLIRHAVHEAESQADRDLDDMLNQEADEALYCYLYGPCEKCRE